ncbi:MAG: phosphatase PAP2 family protein [Actinomycetota bacterium]|nr:phosphatase PAP2 family protein [Actinomycetota bacterium]
MPHGVLDVVRQVALFAAAYYAYRFVRGAVDGKAAEAFANGRELISLERTLNLFFEPAVQAWASGQAWLIDFASWMYVNSHFSITLGALVFIYLFHNSSFYFIRNMFMVAMGLALVGYVLYPTAPPRFFPEWGFTDSVSEFTGIPQDSVAVNALFNPFAAVPSMHVAFALMLGWPLARLVKRRVFKVIWFLYPFLVTFVVVATGNHFWMDAFLGALVAGVSAYVAQAFLARARPGVWAFSPVRAGAPA